MHIRCPHCRMALEVVAEQAVESLSCPSCGADIEASILGDQTVSIDPKKFKHVGQFQLLEMLGQGAFGVVWKARDLDLERLVALKIPRRDQFDEHTFDRFAREAQAAAQVKHPNIVSVYEIGREGDSVYIASEFVDGLSLRDLLERKRFDCRQAAELTAAMAEALHQAHEAGVVHRDLKPANILIDDAGQPHVTDFGLAKRESAEITVTADGQVLGTVAYMSPEQARGESHSADRRSDLYSLGVILYELLCGERPFRGSRSRQLLYQILHDEPRRPRKLDRRIPRDLETICLKALEKEPEKRYATAREMSQDLKRFLRDEPIRARPTGLAERAWRWTRRNPAFASATAVAVLATTLLVAAVAKPRVSSIAEAPVLKTVRLATEPSGATVVLHPLDPITGEPQPERAVRPKQRSPIELRLPAGDYLVVAISHDQGFTFHEVYRRVPADNTGLNGFPHGDWRVAADGAIMLPPIRIPPSSITDGMTRFHGNERFKAGSPILTTAPRHSRRIPGFWLDPAELTVGELRALSPNSQTFTWYAQNGLAPQEDDAVAFVSWDQATAYAEELGKRLPDEWEYEFAATWGGTRKFPWGDDADRIAKWEAGAAGVPEWDQLPTTPPVFGLFSNVAEWTCSWPVSSSLRKLATLSSETFSEERVVRGAPSDGNKPFDPHELAIRDPRSRFVLPRRKWIPTLGFRCARSVRPRLNAEDFSRELSGN